MINVELPNKSDYFRIILVDGDSKEHLIFEAYYPLMNTGLSSFEGICNETCDLEKIKESKSIKGLWSQFPLAVLIYRIWVCFLLDITYL